MRFTIAASTSAFTAGVLASGFEPADFNVTEALLNNGVDITATPGLAGLVERSSPRACSIAVGPYGCCSLPRADTDLASSAQLLGSSSATTLCYHKEV